VRHTRHDVLFEPLAVGGKVFRNRFYSVPHASFPVGRRLSDIAFRRTKAEGGWAAVCGGVVAFRSDSWGGFVPRLYDEDDRAVLRRVAAEVQGQGALAGIELGHGGGRGEGAKFTPAFGASAVADPENPRLVPREMDGDEIRRLQDDWVAAAVTSADLGYDIVYAYGAHGMAPAQFLSPHFNRRTDAYGGPLENRARFWLELLERMRAAIGDRCLIAGRIAAETFSAVGLSAAETLRFIALADHLVDLWDVNVGHTWSRDSAPWRAASEGYQLEWSGRVRSVTAKPIVGVGRLTTPDAMADIVRSGVWDFVGAARPGIADPFLPRKIEAGRYDDLRECTGGNFCIAMETGGIGLSCVQNPTIGEEHRRGWHPERFSPVAGTDPALSSLSMLNVLVVGAGPAGLECARVLGERGVAGVHLVEAAEAVGGHLRWLRLVPGLGGFGRVVDHRTIQLDKLARSGPVRVVTGTRLTVDDVLGYGADIVVVATGARWLGADDDLDVPPLRQLQADGLAVLTPEAVVADDHGPGRGEPVVVWDGDGGGVAVGLVELLVGRGARPVLATPFDRVAPGLDATFEGGTARRRLHELGVDVRLGVTPTAFADGALVLADRVGRATTVAASALVAVARRASDDGLYRALRADPAAQQDAGIRHVWRIGDCVAPRALGLVVADGHRLAREIESDDAGIPAEPRPERDADAATVSFVSLG
jgi:dimethylamine/trimethylamine dehydrogenase